MKIYPKSDCKFYIEKKQYTTEADIIKKPQPLPSILYPKNNGKSIVPFWRDINMSNKYIRDKDLCFDDWRIHRRNECAWLGFPNRTYMKVLLKPPANFGRPPPTSNLKQIRDRIIRAQRRALRLKMQKKLEKQRKEEEIIRKKKEEEERIQKEKRMLMQKFMAERKKKIELKKAEQEKSERKNSSQDKGKTDGKIKRMSEGKEKGKSDSRDKGKGDGKDTMKNDGKYKVNSDGKDKNKSDTKDKGKIDSKDKGKTDAKDKEKNDKVIKDKNKDDIKVKKKNDISIKSKEDNKIIPKGKLYDKNGKVITMDSNILLKKHIKEKAEASRRSSQELRPLSSIKDITDEKNRVPNDNRSLKFNVTTASPNVTKVESNKPQNKDTDKGRNKSSEQLTKEKSAMLSTKLRQSVSPSVTNQLATSPSVTNQKTASQVSLNKSPTVRKSTLKDTSKMPKIIEETAKDEITNHLISEISAKVAVNKNNKFNRI